MIEALLVIAGGVAVLLLAMRLMAASNDHMRRDNALFVARQHPYDKIPPDPPGRVQRPYGQL